MAETTVIVSGELDRLKAEIRQLRRISLCAVLVGTFALVGAGSATWPTAHFDEITAHRIDVVDDDGTLRLAISNREHFPSGVVNHRKLSGRIISDRASLMLYNRNGDEQGSWNWDGGRESKNGGTHQNSLLTMDQYQQNDNVDFYYGERNNQHEAGLEMNEQAETRGLDKMTDLLAAVGRGRSSTEREHLRDAFLSRHFRSYTRFYGGYGADGSMMILGDRKGRPRLRLMVHNDGSPTMQFLDAAGNVTLAFPNAPSNHSAQDKPMPRS